MRMGQIQRGRDLLQRLRRRTVLTLLQSADMALRQPRLLRKLCLSQASCFASFADTAADPVEPRSQIIIRAFDIFESNQFEAGTVQNLIDRLSCALPSFVVAGQKIGKQGANVLLVFTGQLIRHLQALCWSLHHMFRKYRRVGEVRVPSRSWRIRNVPPKTTYSGAAHPHNRQISSSLRPTPKRFPLQPF